jgi:ATP-dependent Lhr-like helicase
MTDVGRVGDVLDRAAKEVDHVILDRISPLSVPALSMIGRESLPSGAADDDLLMEAESLASVAMRVDPVEDVEG